MPMKLCEYAFSGLNENFTKILELDPQTYRKRFHRSANLILTQKLKLVVKLQK